MLILITMNPILKNKLNLLLAALSGLFIFLSTSAIAKESIPENTLRLWIASTAAETGIYDWLLEDFYKTNPDVFVQMHVAGALEVLDQGRKGQADIVITHHPSSEKLFVEEGYGVKRIMVMYNEFAFFGPPHKSLDLSGEKDVRLVMRQLAHEEVRFNSPGTRSGTYIQLTELWSMSGVQPKWVGYDITGESSKSTLKDAALFGNYTFADMGTYLANREELMGKLVPIYRDNTALRNYYSAIIVNGKKFPGVNQKLAEQFLDYLISDRGQERIANFDKYGANLFMPAAHLDDRLKAEKAEASLRAKARLIDLMIGIMVLLVSFSIIASLLWRRASNLEKMHRVSEERFHLAVAGSHDGIWDWDIVNNVSHISSRLKEILGLSQITNTIHDPISIWENRIHFEDRATFSLNLQNYLKENGNGLFNAEFRVEKEEGQYTWVLMRGKALHNKEGKAIRMSGSITDITSLKKQQILEYQALHDALTGLPNRLLLLDRLNQMILTANRKNSQAAVIMIDLNRFKEINDGHGHAVGDQVLQQVVMRLRNVLRGSDTLGRFGGDEFIALLPNIDEKLIIKICDKIQSALKSDLNIADQKLYVGASLGVAVFPKHGEDAHVLLRHADVAMYAAKRSNAGYAFYDDSSLASAS